MSKENDKKYIQHLKFKLSEKDKQLQKAKDLIYHADNEIARLKKEVDLRDDSIIKLNEIEADLQAQLAESPWIKIKEGGENLPDNPDEEVFWLEPSGHIEVYDSEMFAKRDVTHWMSIPDLPALCDQEGGDE